MTRTRAEQTIIDLINAIPGNANYNDLETRRDADRTVRLQAIEALSTAIDEVENAGRDFAAQRRFAVTMATEEAAQRLRFARDRIRTLRYGYGGLFSSNPVDAAALDALRDFDRGLVGRLADVVAKASSLKQPHESDELIIATADEITTETNAFISSLRERNSVIGSVEPAPVPSVSELLGQAQSYSESPESLSTLEVGAAVAVGNANHIVDAMVTFTTSGGTARAWRIQREPERWLVSCGIHGSLRAFSGDASLTPAPPDAKPIWSEKGPATLRTFSAESSEPAVTISVSKLPENSDEFAITIAWKDHQQFLRGQEVPLNAINVFGRPRI